MPLYVRVVLVSGPPDEVGPASSRHRELLRALREEGRLRAAGEFRNGDGFLEITGRKKELLITAAGKNIPPQPIESKLRRNPYVKQAMVIGDGRKYLTALIVPAFNSLESLASRKRILFVNRPELLEHPKIRALYHDIVEEINKDLSRFETVKRFALLPEPFTQESGELTPKNRLRRQIIERHYRREIGDMYWGED